MDNGFKMDNNKKFVEEDSLEMPGDTKQWLSKLLEAPIMQAKNYSRNNLPPLKSNFYGGNPSPEKWQQKKHLTPFCSTSPGSLGLSPSRNRSMMGWMSMEMGEMMTRKL